MMADNNGLDFLSKLPDKIDGNKRLNISHELAMKL